jgi:hypothetical protein
MSALSQDQAALLWRPPLYFDLARINLDSTTPAMMAPAITRIVVRSMFIDYPFSRQSRARLGIIRDPRQDAR